MTEPSTETTDKVAEAAHASTPIASKSLDAARLDECDEEKPSPAKTPKKTKGQKANVESELKKLAQRRINVAGAPKMPLNGYVRFMNDRREELRREQPHRTALEHTKIIGEEWHQLPEERKVPYMEAAAKDKAVYQEQLQLFLKEHPEIVARELAKAKKATKTEGSPKEKTPKSGGNGDTSLGKGKKAKAKPIAAKRQSEEDPDDVPLAQVKRMPTPPPPPPPISTVPAPSPAQPVSSHMMTPIPAPLRPLQPGEIPIYTNEFIEHNRSTENELRTLRKAKTDLEQQNAVLEQHVDNTKAGYAKVMGEVAVLMAENTRLESYVKGLRQKLVSALGAIQLPPQESAGPPSVDNIDRYVRHLAGLAAQPTANASLAKAREALRKVDAASLLVKP
ncbi:high mobility group protein 20A [Drosophila kikkawai]|uniref:High mobility group protein 20A n=1 Tax=Drosophila kikkawai TaxID=30033 RepID=A0A6P4IHP2_DROKI|nr:SWI/SNF-related matrix-associated actin-dependent regulator of chromatin subfamily E member 1-related [Drosophila kikkawai]